MNGESVSYETIKTALSRVTDNPKVTVEEDTVKNTTLINDNGFKKFIKEKRNSQGN